MTFNRLGFFFVLFTIIALPFLAYKLIWLAGSKKTYAMTHYRGKSQTGQLVHDYTVIIFKVGNDTIWFNGNDNLLFKKDEPIPIRYQVNNPKDARIAIFPSLWGDTLVYGGIPMLLLIVIFLDPKIIPLKSKIKLSRKKPVIQIISPSVPSSSYSSLP